MEMVEIGARITVTPSVQLFESDHFEIISPGIHLREWQAHALKEHSNRNDNVKNYLNSRRSLQGAARTFERKCVLGTKGVSERSFNKLV